MQFAFTDLVKSQVVWETVRMARVPKVGDAVVRKGSLVTYLVTGINTAKKTADLEKTKDGTELHRDMPWSELAFLAKAKQRGYPDRRGMGAESTSSLNRSCRMNNTKHNKG